MGLKIGEHVTVRPGHREPYILEFQYCATVVDRTDRGYYLETGDAIDPVDHTPLRFGPFREDQLDRGWSNR